VTLGVAAALHKPEVVIQASGIGYYGFRGDEPVAESAEAGDDFLADVAVNWEESTASVKGLGVRHVIIRTGVVLSPHGGVLPRLASLFRSYLGGPQGSGNQHMPWIHIADEVAAIRFLLDNTTASGPFNLVAPNPATNAEFNHTLSAVLQKPSWLRAPAPALRILLGQKASLLLKGQRAIPQRLLDLGFEFRYPHLDEALRVLLT
jgi:uncharacterized protein (TIGR01777 family)